jgi:shikimate kinase
MIIFVNGSINAGKSTTGKLLAERLNIEFLDFDTISEEITGFDVNNKEHLSQVFDEGIKRLNEMDALGKSTVVSYVFNQHEHDRLEKELTMETKWVTLAPSLEVAQSKRGNRQLSDWEHRRVKFHYDTGVASPDWGIIIDNSKITPAETVDKIIQMLSLT